MALHRLTAYWTEKGPNYFRGPIQVEAASSAEAEAAARESRIIPADPADHEVVVNNGDYDGTYYSAEADERPRGVQATRILTNLDYQKHGDENGYEIWGGKSSDGWNWHIQTPSGERPTLPEDEKPLLGYSHARHVAANLPAARPPAPQGANSANSPMPVVSCQEEPTNAE